MAMLARVLTGAGIPVAMHLGDSGYQRWNARWGEAEEFAPFSSEPMHLGSMVSGSRAIHDAVAKLIMDGVPHRFPNLRFVSVENGSDWLMTRLCPKRSVVPASTTRVPSRSCSWKKFTRPAAFPLPKPSALP